MFDADDVVWTWFFVILFAVIMAFAIKQGCEESDRQAVIRARCKPIRHVAGQTVVVSTGKGVGVGGTSGQTCYRCPDGMEECF